MLRKLGQKIGVRTEKIQSTLGIDPGSAVSEDEHITPTAIIQNRFKMTLLLIFFQPKDVDHLQHHHHQESSEVTLNMLNATGDNCFE